MLAKFLEAYRRLRRSFGCRSENAGGIGPIEQQEGTGRRQHDGSGARRLRRNVDDGRRRSGGLLGRGSGRCRGRRRSEIGIVRRRKLAVGAGNGNERQQQKESRSYDGQAVVGIGARLAPTAMGALLLRTRARSRTECNRPVKTNQWRKYVGELKELPIKYQPFQGSGTGNLG